MASASKIEFTKSRIELIDFTKLTWCEMAEVDRFAGVRNCRSRLMASEKLCPVCKTAQPITPTGVVVPHKKPEGIGRCPGSERLPYVKTTSRGAD